MNEASWVIFGATIVVQLLGYAFTYGLLTQKVKNHENTLLRHDRVQEDHGKALLRHEGKISKIEGKLAIESDDEN